jgi:hypothetical protein
VQDGLQILCYWNNGLQKQSVFWRNCRAAGPCIPLFSDPKCCFHGNFHSSSSDCLKFLSKKEKLWHLNAMIMHLSWSLVVLFSSWLCWPDLTCYMVLSLILWTNKLSKIHRLENDIHYPILLPTSITCHPHIRLYS